MLSSASAVSSAIRCWTSWTAGRERRLNLAAAMTTNGTGSSASAASQGLIANITAAREQDRERVLGQEDEAVAEEEADRLQVDGRARHQLPRLLAVEEAQLERLEVGVDLLAQVELDRERDPARDEAAREGEPEAQQPGADDREPRAAAGRSGRRSGSRRPPRPPATGSRRSSPSPAMPGRARRSACAGMGAGSRAGGEKSASPLTIQSEVKRKSRPRFILGRVRSRIAIAPARPRGRDGPRRSRRRPGPGAGGGPAQASSAKRWSKLEPSPLRAHRGRRGARRPTTSTSSAASCSPAGEHDNKVARYDIRRDRWKRRRADAARGQPPDGGVLGRQGLRPRRLHQRVRAHRRDGAAFRVRPEGDRWRELAPSTVPRAAHALVAIDGRLYAAGGANSTTRPAHLARGLRHRGRDLEPGRRDGHGPKPRRRRRRRRALLRDGRRGRRSTSRSWSATTRRRTRGRRSRRSTLRAAASPPPSSAAGSSPSAVRARRSSRPVEIYDPAANAWASLPDMRTPRHGLGGASKGGRVYALEGGPQPGFAFSRGRRVPRRDSRR